MVKNSIFSEMTGKYLPDSGFETIGASGIFWPKSTGLRILCTVLFRLIRRPAGGDQSSHGKQAPHVQTEHSVTKSYPVLGTIRMVTKTDNSKCKPARVFTGARVFRSLYAFKVPNHHSKQCVQSHLHRRSISKRGFRAPWKLAKCKLASC